MFINSWSTTKDCDSKYKVHHQVQYFFDNTHKESPFVWSKTGVNKSTVCMKTTFIGTNWMSPLKEISVTDSICMLKYS